MAYRSNNRSYGRKAGAGGYRKSGGGRRAAGGAVRRAGGGSRVRRTAGVSKVQTVRIVLQTAPTQPIAAVGSPVEVKPKRAKY